MIYAEIAMGLAAALAAQKQSPDPLKKVGLVIMSSMGNLICAGFNHTKGIEPPIFEGDRTIERRPFPIHAEIDALTKIGTWKEVKNKIVVTTLFPCAHCMTALAAIHVTKIYYKEVYPKDAESFEIAKFYGIECFILP